jgi:hypothetical protein
VFLQQVQGRSALTAGLWLLPVGVLTAACAPVAGRMMARAGARPPILAGLGAACLAFVALLRLDPGTSFPDVWWAFALLGVGTGLALPPMTATAVGAVRAQQAGMASAIHNASRQIGQTFAVAILGTILFARAGDAADQRRTDGGGGRRLGRRPALGARRGGRGAGLRGRGDRRAAPARAGLALGGRQLDAEPRHAHGEREVAAPPMRVVAAGQLQLRGVPRLEAVAVAQELEGDVPALVVA